MRFTLVFIVITLLVALGAWLILRQLVVTWVSPEPETIGVQNGRLAPCPDTPNCVSSYADDEQHAIEPIRYEGPQADARDRLLGAVRSMPRSFVETTEDDYVHVIFRSPTLGFYDDTELYFAEPGVIHVRSAARLGQGDMGANRKYVEEIRQRFASAS
ncbi:MAG: DUF1499 domain-containing protein [Trueperaceae bacterium]|nr:DUF1499 domain-containing protein [Trueperaceae bacterium]